MVDTGTSLNELERFVRKYEPKSVYSACLLVKRITNGIEEIPPYNSFSCLSIWYESYCFLHIFVFS
ncbi:unnamed protein product [Schistosoma rodhaini]|uniref:Uncharacterized protein n=1 Tax=Schistosoma rodhaini TaxID=6188 RepID=A0AA85G464_9TREM|nr:unnamed protein product [Schistosoma rodhaini]